MSERNPIGQDGIGFNILKDAVLTMLNDFPGLKGQKIVFSGLETEGDISMEPESGALIYSESKNIVGETTRMCQFPFFVVYRTGGTSEFHKMNINEFLDTLGAWLCREPVTIDDMEHRLLAFPALTGGRQITGITRFNSYSVSAEEGFQDWAIPITVNYKHQFTAW